MAQSGYTPIALYYSDVPTNTPSSADLVPGQLAINIADGKVYYKDDSNVVQILAGLSGYSGYSGYSGINGASGYSGINGASGYSGYSGSGISGYSGLGLSGYSGISGYSGSSVYTSTPNTWTATQTFNGSSSTEATKILNIAEPANVVSAAPSTTTNFYINSGSVQYYTSNTVNNWTLNFAFSSGTTLNSAMSTNDSISCTLIVTQSSPAYYPSAFQIDGTSSGVTVKWQGLAPTSGDINSLDSYTFVLIKTASATYTVLATATKFS